MPLIPFPPPHLLLPTTARRLDPLSHGSFIKATLDFQGHRGIISWLRKKIPRSPVARDGTTKEGNPPHDKSQIVEGLQPKTDQSSLTEKKPIHAEASSLSDNSKDMTLIRSGRKSAKSQRRIIPLPDKPMPMSIAQLPTKMQNALIEGKPNKYQLLYHPINKELLKYEERVKESLYQFKEETKDLPCRLPKESKYKHLVVQEEFKDCWPPAPLSPKQDKPRTRPEHAHKKAPLMQQIHSLQRQKYMGVLEYVSKGFITKENLDQAIANAIEHPTTYNVPPEDMLKQKFEIQCVYDYVCKKVDTAYVESGGSFPKTKKEITEIERQKGLESYKFSHENS